MTMIAMLSVEVALRKTNRHQKKMTYSQSIVDRSCSAQYRHGS